MSEDGSCIPKCTVNVSSVSKNWSLWRTHVHAINTFSLCDANRAEITFPTPSISATDLIQSVNAPNFLHVIQLFLIHKTLLVHQTCKQIQGAIVRRQGFYLLIQCQSACFLAILSVTLQESQADLCFLFSLSLPEVSTACPDCFWHLLPFKKGAHTENSHMDFHLQLRDKTSPKLPSVVAVCTDQASFLVTVTVSPVQHDWIENQCPGSLKDKQVRGKMRRGVCVGGRF